MEHIDTLYGPLTHAWAIINILSMVGIPITILWYFGRRAILRHHVPSHEFRTATTAFVGTTLPLLVTILPWIVAAQVLRGNRTDYDPTTLPNLTESGLTLDEFTRSLAWIPVGITLAAIFYYLANRFLFETTWFTNDSNLREASLEQRSLSTILPTHTTITLAATTVVSLTVTALIMGDLTAIAVMLGCAIVAAIIARIALHNIVNRRASRNLTLEEAMEFCGNDECVEVAPDVVRVRKVLLNATERARARSREKARNK